MVHQIAGYEIIGEVGQGAMATVYRARAVDPASQGDVSHGDVAIKVLRREYLNDLGFRARFEREGQLITRLTHPAIVAVYSFGHFENQLYIVMAYMPHGSLAQRLLQGPLPFDTAMDIVARVGVALDYAHGQGVVHRDLKPSNVLFDARDDAYLADFGIAWQAQSGGRSNATISGTPAYMSPEQARREEAIGAASDLYALGVLGFQLLTGQLPFRAETPVAVLVQHMQEAPPAAREINPALPAGVEPVLTKALAKEPEQRYESAAAFVAALRRALAGGSGVAVTAGAHLATAAGDGQANGAQEQDVQEVSEPQADAQEKGLAWRERWWGQSGRLSRHIGLYREQLARWLSARPALAFALATGLGIFCALAAVVLLRGLQLPVTASAGGPPVASLDGQSVEGQNGQAEGSSAGAAIMAGTTAARVFLPLTWLDPGRVTPTATVAPTPAANVRMLYDGGMVTLLNSSAQHLSLSDLALRRVTSEGAASPTLQVSVLGRVAGGAVSTLPPGDCLQLLGVEAVRNRRAGKPPACGTLRGWLATQQTNQLFEGWREGDSYEVLHGERRLQICALADGSCEFFVAQE